MPVKASDLFRELSAAYNRKRAAQAVVREIWPWLNDAEVEAIAKILVEAFAKR